jgi:5-methylcytosine-specific restriction endonuclease McrA
MPTKNFKLFNKTWENIRCQIYITKNRILYTCWDNRKITSKKHYDKQSELFDKNIKNNTSCALCGYDKYLEALEFHHVNPEDKKFSISAITYNNPNLIIEMQKCIVLCSNCHAYITRLERKND